MKGTRYLIVAAAAVTCIGSATIANSAATMTQKQARLQGLTTTMKLPLEQSVSRVIVKMRDGALVARAQTARAARVRELEATAGVGMEHVRDMAGGASLFALGAPMPLAEANAVVARLARDPTVEYAAPDVLLKKAATPTEPRFTQWQWNLFAPSATYDGLVFPGNTPKSATATGGTNMPPAWDLTTGESSVVVAILDTGIVNHPDLNGTATPAPYAAAGRFLPGYDFISSDVGAGTLPANFTANDNDGRDADPTDAGDWVTATEESTYPVLCDDGNAGPQNSSWHGTHMAGVVAATTNNNLGIAGVAWNIRVQPLRVLGKCGGSTSDIADAIQWAAGLAVPGVPANPTPARVISLSLSAGPGSTCSGPMAAAVNAALAAGSIVVAATGNDGLENSVSAPANCPGVLGVTAHTINGENADYANIGAEVALSAPGGGPPTSLGAGGATDDSSWTGFFIWSTLLFGEMGPTSMDAQNRSGAAYGGFTGTSPATPHAAGVAALVKSVLPNATPADIRSKLVTNTRAFPAMSVCASGQLYSGRCGSGLLDANLVLVAVGPDVTPTAAANTDQVVAPGSLVTLNGTASKAFGSKTIQSYQWTQTGGTPTVTLSTPTAATTSFTAPSTGTLTFRLRVTDNAGKVGDDFISVRANNPPALNPAPPSQSATSGNVVTFTVAGTDPDGDALTYVATSASNVPLSALAPNGTFTWNTAGMPGGNYTLIYFATDGAAQTLTQSVTITLAGAQAAGGAPAPTSGGGGALPLGQLLLLGALLFAARLRGRE